MPGSRKAQRLQAEVKLQTTESWQVSPSGAGARDSLYPSDGLWGKSRGSITERAEAERSMGTVSLFRYVPEVFKQEALDRQGQS